MSGYTPIFRSIFQGTLCGKYPELPVWLVLLALSDRHGEIDAHPSFIATVSGIPQTDIETAIKRFCEPDEASRTPDEDGRRLTPIPGRGFGWIIVNHGKYREKARKAMRQIEETAAGRDAQRKRVERERNRPAESGDVRRSPASPAESGGVRLSDSDADSDKREGEGTGVPARRSRRCPEGFKPDPAVALKLCPDMDVEREIQKLRDFEFRTPRSDWPAVWRTWCSRCQQTGDYVKRGGKDDIWAFARAAS